MFLIIVALCAFATQASAKEPPPEPARSVIPPPATSGVLIRNIYKSREKQEFWLRENRMSYLAAAGRKDFGDRTSLAIGRDSTNDLRLDDVEVQPHHLRVTVVGDSFRLEAVDEKALFKLEGGFDHLRNATLGPSGILVGRFLLRLSHQNHPGIIVFDPQSPRLHEYRGLKHYAPDLSYRYVLPLTPDPKPDTVMVQSSRGTPRPALRMGWFDFMVGRTRCRLEAVRLLEPGVDENTLGVYFRDATNGKETYSMGRYVDPKPVPGEPNRYTLDFNMAYNPACAFSEFFNCPLPSNANQLKVALPAGEKDSHYH